MDTAHKTSSHSTRNSGEMGTSPPAITTATSAAIPTPAPPRKARSRDPTGSSSPSLAAIAIPSSASSSVVSLSAAPSPALPQRSPSQSSLTRSASRHRHSFASSPRAPRHPSFTQAALQELLSRPSDPHRNADPRFAGRDWRDVTVGELVSSEDLKWAEMDTSVEQATKTLLRNGRGNTVLVRDTISSNHAVSTFDYSDLNAYLLVVVGLAQPDESTIELYDEIASKAREGRSILLREIQSICTKEELMTLQASETLDKAIEILGSGIHRVLILDGVKGVVGILSQLRLVEFFWNEGVHFPTIEGLYPVMLRDLGIGTPGPHIVSINADNPLSDALTSMQNEGLTSIAVVDNGRNVTGNISTVDVKHLTSTSSAPLLKGTCMHFISVILSERGVEEGRDPFPVFHVSPYSTLAHVVAKLVATRSHRMWVVEGPSPAPSAPETPQLAPTVLSTSVPQSPLPPGPPSHPSVPASAMPGAHLSGRLTGVVSLTDVLNIFARSSGLNPSDPSEQRARRRRSSSSSVRPSLDCTSTRASMDVRR